MVDWALPLKYKGVADELLTQVSRSSENSYCELVHRLPATLSSEGIALRQSVMWSQSLLTLDPSFLILEDFYKSKLFPHPRECSRRCKGSEPGNFVLIPPTNRTFIQLSLVTLPLNSCLEASTLNPFHIPDPTDHFLILDHQVGICDKMQESRGRTRDSRKLLFDCLE